MAQGLSVKPVRAITWTEVGGREAALIQRCAARDEEACAELVNEHQRMVYQLSLNLLGDHNEALDLSQEVFLRVFRTIHTFRGQSALRTWIFRIVINQARNRQRWWRRRHRSQQVSLDEHIRDHGDPPERSNEGSPDRVLGPEGARRPDSDGARRAAVRSAHGARSARDRRVELRRDRILARHRGRHGEIAPREGSGSPSRGIEGRMRLLTCAAVRRRLAAFHDRELPVGEMIAFESHIKDCPPCAGELAELEDIGSLLRTAAAPAPADEVGGSGARRRRAGCAPRTTSRCARGSAACSKTCTWSGLRWPRRRRRSCAARSRSARCSLPRPSATIRWRR